MFIGTHFFGPVERMPLVEIILTPDTSNEVRKRTLKLLKTLRKTPLVVNDGPGFFTSRCVASYTGEALTLLAEGIAPARIDAAARRYGMVIGPCAMADLTGEKLLEDIFASIQREGSRVTEGGSRAIEALGKLVAANRLGRAAGAGVYDYPKGNLQDWPGIANVFPAQGDDVSDEDIGRRLMHVQALEEGVIARPADADIGSLLGWMFPQSYGGVLSYVDTIGARRFVEDCESLAERFGSRFTPPEGLVELARKNGRLHPL
jgi:3-hydroxyacyl-CoA dehydrogenase/enoyl-CoA hydratase/3-hydroxybutyryl-CoA epimerase